MSKGKKLIKISAESVLNKLQNNEIIKRITINIGWLFFDNFFRMFLAFIVSIFVIRYLGSKQYGILSYSTAYVALFSGLATLGLGGVVVRELVSLPEKKHLLLGTTFILRIISGLLLITLVVISIKIIRPGDSLTQTIVFIIAIGTLFEAFIGIEYWFQAQINSKFTVYSKSAALIISSILKIVAVLLGASLIIFAVITTINIFLYCLFLLYFYHITDGDIREWKFSSSLAYSLLRKSWPLMFSSVFVLMTMNIDKIMLGEMLGHSEVGIYSVAVLISTVIYFIPVAVGNSVAPALIQIRKDEGENNYLRKLQQVYNFMTKLSLLIILVFSLCSSLIIDVLFGPEFAVASKVLIVHIWTSLFVFHVSIRTQALVIENLQLYVSVYSLFTLITNIILNYILINNYGIIGAAYASLISWALTVLVLPLLFRNTRIAVPMFLKSFLPLRSKN